MTQNTPKIQDLARRLVALETAREESDEASVSAVMLACEKLRAPLAKLVGEVGFRSLLSRALAMAKREFPSLEAALVRTDGTLDGLDGIERATDAAAGVVVVAQLLSLLVTFIGEPLTQGLVRDAWPDAPLDETYRRAEAQL